MLKTLSVLRKEFYLRKHGVPVFRSIRDTVFEKYPNLVVSDCSREEITIKAYSKDGNYIHAFMYLCEDGTPYYNASITLNRRLKTAGFNNHQKFIECIFNGLKELNEIAGGD